MSKNDHKNKKDSTKRKGKNNLIENKIKFKYPTLYFLGVSRKLCKFF